MTFLTHAYARRKTAAMLLAFAAPLLATSVSHAADA